MKKYLETYKKLIDYIHICDNCGKELIYDKNWIVYDFTWSDGYDSFGDEYEVCSLECLKKKLDGPLSREYDFPSGQSVKLDLPSEIAKQLLLGK